MDTLPSSSVFVDMELSVDESPEDYNSVIGSISVPAGSGWAAWREAAAQAQADLDVRARAVPGLLRGVIPLCPFCRIS